MMLQKIWQRYLFSNLIQTFLFFLFCFFLLYSLIDFSTHMQDFVHQNAIQFQKLGLYYLYQLIKRLPLLLPLALLLSTIKVLNSLNIHRELIALLVSGIKIKKIMHPFFLLALICCFLGYANEEVFMPKALAYLDLSKKDEKKDPLFKAKKKQFTLLHLQDTSKLIYQRIEKDKNVFFDVYWVRSFDDIWKIKTLSTDPEKPIGEFVDHIVRNKQGFLEKQESYDRVLLSRLKWNTNQLNQKQSSIRHQKISELTSHLCHQDQYSFHKQGEIKTHFMYKLLMPLLPF